MNTVGLITEYNPFHYGHQYHLKKSLSTTNATHSISIMSSSFMQRGEPAIVDKWTRAKMAIDNGVDLVLELPFVYSCQSAELFALGAIKTLNALNIIDYLSFGSEIGRIEPLNIMASILVDEPKEYRNYLRYHLDNGESFAVSRSMALEKYLKNNKLYREYPFKKILTGSNNILGIEYIKALKKLQSPIKPITIQRKGYDYSDTNIGNKYASASGIRKHIFNYGLESIENLLPEASYLLLKEYISQYGNFNCLANYEQLIKYVLLTKDKTEIQNILDIEDGLENRLINQSQLHNDIKKIIMATSSKRYPSTRIQRILIHLLNNLTGPSIRELYDSKPIYIRILAANSNGLELLNSIKNNSDISIITKFSHYKKYNNEVMEKFLFYERQASDLYFLGLDLDKKFTKYDYYISPYIK